MASLDGIFTQPYQGTEDCSQLISAATRSSNGSSLPLATGIPLFGDFCNGHVKYEKCYWHMAVEIDYWLHTTITIPVKTVSINVTLDPTATITGPPITITAAQSDIYDSEMDLMNSILPEPNRKPGVTWKSPPNPKAVDVTYIEQSEYSYRYATPGTVVAEHIGLDVAATRVCNDGRSTVLNCFGGLLNQHPESDPVIRMNQDDWNFPASNKDMDFLTHRSFNSAFKVIHPELTACEGWGFGYPEAMAPVRYLTTTITSLYDARSRVTPRPGSTNPASPGPTAQYQSAPDQISAPANTANTRQENNVSSQETGVGTGQPRSSAGFVKSEAAVITIGGQSYVYQSGARTLVIGSTTITAGGSAATTGGHVISIGSAGVVLDGTTVKPTMQPTPAGTTASANRPSGTTRAVNPNDGARSHISVIRIGIFGLLAGLSGRILFS